MVEATLIVERRREIKREPCVSAVEPAMHIAMGQRVLAKLVHKDVRVLEERIDGVFCHLHAPPR